MTGGKKDTEKKPMKKTSEKSIEQPEKENNIDEQVFLYWN